MILKINISEPCQLTSYSTETLSYDRNSMMAQATLKHAFKTTKIAFETMENRTSLFINYPIMEVKVSQQVRILDTSSFISSVGGNLGLFIGFSFSKIMSFILAEIQMLTTRLQRSSRRK